MAIVWRKMDLDKPGSAGCPIPYWSLADREHVQSRLGMTQFPILASFEPKTTRGTPKVLYEHLN